MFEIWKPVPGYEGRYEVSNLGRVRSLPHRVRFVAHGKETTRLSPGRALRPGRSGLYGHVTVAPGKGNSRPVHQLVAKAFIGPRPANMDVAHADGDGANNKVENLRYTTRSQNNGDRVLQGKTRITPDIVRRIREKAPLMPHGGKIKLARELGINPCTISDVLAGRRHLHA
ncbi:NUMOD4 motif-containing HNH endonuclease [Mixta mediterraneensis]|uniref:NUMOD4 motif-containing HNH endonuclease n=1 Tax=Mixta mediterraneensis TaxID=2758443 RepID=UPI003B00D915